MVQDTATGKGATRVLIVEDHQFYALGLEASFKRFSDQVEIIGIATNVKDAIRQVQEKNPDLVLLDLHLPQEANSLRERRYKYGLDLIEDLRNIAKDMRILVLSLFERGRDHDDYAIRPEIVQRAIDAPANGYIAKDDNYDGEALTDAIRRTMRGEFFLSPLAAEVIRQTLYAVGRDHEDRPDEHEPLTPRERDIVPLLPEGLTNQEIANRLYTSESNVRSHNVRIYRKLGAKGRNDPKIRQAAHRIRVGEM